MKKKKNIFTRLRDERGRYIEKAKARFFFEIAGVKKNLPLNRFGKVDFTKERIEEIKEDAQKIAKDLAKDRERLENLSFYDFFAINSTIDLILKHKGTIQIETPKSVFECDKLNAVEWVTRYEQLIKEMFTEVVQVIYPITFKGEILKIECK